ncbi:type VI secretion system tip protein VgrG [Bacillus subtilis subsp. subtilis]|nr:type VI secretion system tip protein VgrG [Bacillus subtilis subsp. subtilis]
MADKAMDALNNLFSQVAAVSDAQRLHRLALPGATTVVVERWSGEESLSAHFDYVIDFLSLDAGLELEPWLGKPATLSTRAASGADIERVGLVSDASLLGSDGGVARYRIRLRPWTWWLEHGRHSRVFQERSVQDILSSVFESYRNIARWQWSDEVAGFLGAERKRSYCVQYRESDAAFVQRLLAEEGLGWRVQNDAEAPAGHGMVIFSDSGTQPEDVTSSGRGVRFHRSAATESEDTVQALGQSRRLGSNRLTVFSGDYKRSSGQGAQVPVDGGGSQSSREAYDPAGAYAFADSSDGDRLAGLQAEAHEARNQAWRGRSSVRSLCVGQWLRIGQVPASAPSEVLLTCVWHIGINNLPVDLRASLEHALGASTFVHAADPAVRERADAVGYANAFAAIQRTTPWRPVLHDDTGARLNPRPLAPGYQTAIVVGAPGSSGSHEVHADQAGRIRVKFHFQSGQGDGAQDSAWLRVAQRYAGPGVGSQFLPRIGQEVLVGFLDGDIDRPLVLGALYNGRGEAGVAPTPAGQAASSDTAAYAQAADARASAQANLAGGHAPAWHAAAAGEDAHRHPGALWGVRSKEWGGSGYNALLFDDSDTQLRAQLQTTQAVTSLNLGHLIHQADNFRGSLRGEGFELRSDAWGALRARSGLWLSGYARGAQGKAGEAAQPVALLTQLQTLGTSFATAASTHLTSKLAAHEGVQQPNRSQLVQDKAPLAALVASARTTVEGAAYAPARGQARERDGSAGEAKVPHVGDALLGLAAPDGVVQVAGQALGWAIGETLTLGSGQASEAVVMGQLRLHAAQSIGVLTTAVQGKAGAAAALTVVAGQGELDMQAQQDEMRLQAQAGLNMASAQSQFDLSAGKTLHVATAGGASLTIEGGNITFTAPGNIVVHAGKKSFTGPSSYQAELKSWVHGDLKKQRIIGFSG